MYIYIEGLRASASHNFLALLSHTGLTRGGKLIVFPGGWLNGRAPRLHRGGWGFESLTAQVFPGSGNF